MFSSFFTFFSFSLLFFTATAASCNYLALAYWRWR